MFGAWIFWRRNTEVYDYRRMIIAHIFRDKNAHKIDHRIDYFHTVTYDEMVLKFWKPVESFYDMEEFD